MASDLLKFLEVNEATLDALNSNDTPILKEGIDIHLPNDIGSVDDAPSSKRQKVESSDECANNTITDCSFNGTNECPVCSEELFDENGVADKKVAGVLVIILSTRTALFKLGGTSTQMASGLALVHLDLTPAAPSAKDQFPCGFHTLMHVNSRDSGLNGLRTL